MGIQNINCLREGMKVPVGSYGLVAYIGEYRGRYHFLGKDEEKGRIRISIGKKHAILLEGVIEADSQNKKAHFSETSYSPKKMKAIA